MPPLSPVYALFVQHELERQVIEAADNLNNTRQEICSDISREVCRLVCIAHKPLSTDCLVEAPSCRDIVENVCRTDPAYTISRNTLLEKQRLENRASSALAQAFTDFRSAISIALTTSETLIQAEIEFSQAAMDSLQRFHMDIDPISGIFKEWHKDINKASNAYFLANATALKNAISNKSPIQPLKDWTACWMPAIIGIPSEVINGICIAHGTYKEIIDALDAIEKLAIKQDPILREVVRLKNEIISELTKALTDELYDFSEKTTGVNVEHLVKLIKEKPTPEILNAEFSTVPSNKSLLIINDIFERVDAEMHLENGVFNPEKFNAIYNAIVLSKLSILDAKGLIN